MARNLSTRYLRAHLKFKRFFDLMVQFFKSLLGRLVIKFKRQLSKIRQSKFRPTKLPSFGNQIKSSGNQTKLRINKKI